MTDYATRFRVAAYWGIMPTGGAPTARPPVNDILPFQGKILKLIALGRAFGTATYIIDSQSNIAKRCPYFEDEIIVRQHRSYSLNKIAVTLSLHSAMCKIGICHECGSEKGSREFRSKSRPDIIAAPTVFITSHTFMVDRRFSNGYMS